MDPTLLIVDLGPTGDRGNVALRIGAIESVNRESMAVLTVKISGHMTLYIENEDGLFAFLLGKMKQCAEYSDAQAELAAGAIS